MLRSYLFLPRLLLTFHPHVGPLCVCAISGLQQRTPEPTPPVLISHIHQAVRWSAGLVITTSYLLVIGCRAQSYKHAAKNNGRASARHHRPASACYGCNRRTLAHKATHLEWDSALMGGRAAVPGSALRSNHWAGGDAMAGETVKAGGALRLLTGRLVRRATV